MRSELLAESLSLIVYGVVAAVLTAGGVFAEYTSVQYLGSGEITVALWLAAIGAIMLYAGVRIGSQKVLVRFGH